MIRKFTMTFVLTSMLVLFVFSMTANAQDDTDKPCKYTAASGLQNIGGTGVFTTDCSPENLAKFMNTLNTFFYRLAIVLAVLMITIGGMQWLMAIGNSGKISTAKETIEQAVIGLILALVAILLFNQIDTSFTNLKIDTLKLSPSEEKPCDKRETAAECAASSSFTCNWVPTNEATTGYFVGKCMGSLCTTEKVKTAESRWNQRVQASGQQDQYCYITLNERSCLSFTPIKNDLHCCVGEGTGGRQTYMYAIGAQRCKTCSRPDGGSAGVTAYWREQQIGDCDRRAYSEILEK